jgi:hypothetical protein
MFANWFSNWVRNLKWALLIAIIAGPGFAYYSFTEAGKIEQVMASGVEAEAFVAGGSVTSGRRRGTTYKLDAIWADAGGAPQQQEIAISSEFASQVIVDDTLTIDLVHVKYVPDNAELPVIIVEDAANQLADNRMMIWLGIAAGIIGAIGSALFFLFGRKKKEDTPDAAAA